MVQRFGLFRINLKVETRKDVPTSGGQASPKLGTSVDLTLNPGRLRRRQRFTRLWCAGKPRNPYCLYTLCLALAAFVKIST